MADFALLEFPKLISRKIWVVEKSWHFQIVILWRALLDWTIISIFFFFFIPEELETYKNIDFDVHDFKNDIKTPKLTYDGDKVKTLMSRWRFPSLSLHGIEGAFSDTGAKTVIPRKVIGKFSIRIVPNQTPESVEKVVIEHCNKKWAERGKHWKSLVCLDYLFYLIDIWFFLVNRII